MDRRYIVTNFAYGNGPYVMTTKLAVTFNDELEKAGQPRMGIIVPHIYGEKQKEIMAEEGLLSDEIILDAKLGAILAKVFYSNTDYAAYLAQWTANFKEVSREANAYLSETYGAAIAVELSRSPRVLYGLRVPMYSTSFGHMSQIFEKAKEVPAIKIPKDLLGKAAEVAKCIEREQQILAVGYPGVFSYDKEYAPVYKQEIGVPPIAPMPKPDTSEIEKGIFITKTGIPGLERLYGEIEKSGLKVYTNTDHSPAMITNKNILLHFARAGWASIWFSMLAGKPLVIPAYDAKDDPEIYFNNTAIAALGIGITYRGQSIGELIKEAEKAAGRCRAMNESILDCWKTLDGTRYSAKIFAKDFLRVV